MENRVINLENFYNIRIVHTCGLLEANFDGNIPHSHSHCELFIHVGGDIEIFVEKNAYKVSAGTVRIYASGELHYGKCDAGVAAQWYQISIPKEFFDCGLYKELGDIFYNRPFGKGNVFASKKEQKLRELAEEMFASTERTVPMAVSNVLKILCIINETSNNVTEYAKFKTDEMEKILNAINYNCIFIHSLNDLCRLTHYSRTYLNRLFKENLDITPYKFLVGKKLDNSKKALENGKNVFDACECGGFNDYNNFITLFRKTFGVTPNQYKNQCIGKTYTRQPR